MNMCDITNRNFYVEYFNIVKHITSSDFISIDCEFSGLFMHEKYRASLFDSPAERYEKLRKGIEDFSAFQIGISVFTYTDEKYEVITYTFYLFPRSYSGKRAVFSCESKCLEFLCEQNFDFNTLFQYGVTFACAADEKVIRAEVDDGSLVRRVKSGLSPEDREVIRSFCREVSNWSQTAAVGDSITLTVSKMEPFLRYLVWEEIETQNFDVTVTRENWTSLRVQKVKASEKNPVTQDDEQKAKKDDLLTLVFGFTKIVNVIISLKKPIIGHNLFIDLLMIYKMFVSPLPKEYHEFKTEITKMFPEVYDTKFLSYRLRGMVGGKDLWGCNTLRYLYQYFKDEKGATIVMNMPVIEHKTAAPMCEHFHDAGFDSYCTGYVFLMLAHMFSMWDEEEGAFKRVCLGNGPVGYFGSVRSMRNHINVMRSQFGHIDLDGPDPENSKPDLILVESKGRSIDIDKVSDGIAKYDNADIKQVTSSQILIASSSELTSKMIIRHFLRDPSVRVSKYRGEEKKSLQWAAAAAALLGGAGLLSFLLYRKVNGPDVGWPWLRTAVI